MLEVVKKGRKQDAADWYILLHAPVAQLDRAPDFESVGRRFESCRARHSEVRKEKFKVSVFEDSPIASAVL